MHLQPVDLRAIWSVLSRPNSLMFNSYPLEGAFDGTRLAVDASGYRHLLVEHDTDAPIYIVNGLLSEHSRTLSFNGQTSTYLDIAMTDPSLSDEFDTLICAVLKEEESRAIRAHAVHAALVDWRSLLKMALSRSLTAERRIGLFGELFVLENLMQGVGSATHFDIWTGPLGQPHDFELPRRCIEVKTTGPNGSSVRIHGLRQLEIDRNGLDLIILTVSEGPSGESLATISNRLRDSFGDQGFDALLARAGWSSGMSPGPKYIVESALLVPVVAETTRLTTSKVPPGIHGVHYDVDVEMLRPSSTSLSRPALEQYLRSDA